MATQSLLEFQKELMARLQNVGKTSDISSWLAVEVAGGHRYLIPLEDSGGVALLSSIDYIEPVSHTQFWFVGMINHRGMPYALIDLAGWLGIRVGVADIAYMTRRNASLVMFNPALEINCALLVDRIVGLRNNSDFQKAASPDANETGEYLLDKDQNIWQVMRLSDLAHDEYFLHIEKDM